MIGFFYGLLLMLNVFRTYLVFFANWSFIKILGDKFMEFQRSRQETRYDFNKKSYNLRIVFGQLFLQMSLKRLLS